MRYQVLFFDLDDTLYPNSTGLWAAIRERMGLYMSEQLHFPPELVPSLRKQYYETYGTTLRGLQLHHKVDALEFLAYVHDLPLEKYLRPAPELREILTSLPQPRYIFTNSDRNHARRVLSVLGLQDCFDGVIDILALEFTCKPSPEAYSRALALAGQPDPRNCVLLDDAPSNLRPAQALGFRTVLVGSNGTPEPAADLVVPEMSSLPDVFPDLWEVN